MAKTIIKLPTIKELRKRGWKVRSSHFRYFKTWDSRSLSWSEPSLLPTRDAKNEVGNYCLPIEPNGGKITLELRSPEGVESRGEATCSRKDPFSKREGRSRALFRALNIQRPESKFKAGDKVWVVDRHMKAREVEVESHYINEPEFNLEEGSVVFEEFFEVKDGEFDFFTLEPQAFSTKEELMEFVQS